jgi:glycine cleavage system aminomethyltransferase T
MFSCFANSDGGIVDDLLVYKMKEEQLSMRRKMHKDTELLVTVGELVKHLN